MIFFSSIGGAYFEGLLYNDFQLKLSIINQNGLSEWIFLKLSSEIAQILNTSQLFTKLITALSSLIISLIMFVWISSLGFQETKFLKFLLRPFFLPLIWILNILYNLFFVSQKNYENETTQNQKSFS